MTGRDRLAVAIAIGAAAVAGCGSATPVAPSSAADPVAAQAAVSTTVSQAMTHAAIVGSFGALTGPTYSFPCPDGGSITSTFTMPPLAPGTETVRLSSRMEFNDCRSKTVVMQGDPYLETSMEYAGLTMPAAGGSTTFTSTMRTVGGLKLATNGVQGRVQYDCTQLMTLEVVNGGSKISMTSSGTTTWEQPLGSTPRVGTCGPQSP